MRAGDERPRAGDVGRARERRTAAGRTRPARTIRNRLVNPIVAAVLRSPLHRLLSGALILVTYRGRRTGRQRTIPVMYAQDRDRLIVLVGDAPAKQWWRNLRGGAPVEVRLRGARRRGSATVAMGGPGELTAPLSAYLARFPRAARAASVEQPVMVLIDLAPDATRP